MEIKTLEVDCGVCGSNFFTELFAGHDYEYSTSDQSYRFVICNNCETIYPNPRPAESELSKIYPSDYIPYRFEQSLNPIVKKARQIVQKNKIKSLLKYLAKGAIILDAGCGDGQFLRIVKQFGDPTWQLYGNDIDLRTKDILAQDNIKFICGRFEAIENYNNFFDIIILNQVLEHLVNPQQVIERAYQMLKPKGILFIETPNYNSLDRKVFSSKYWGGYHIPRHWHIFNNQNIVDFLEKNKYKVIKIEYLLSPTFWVQSLHHYFYDKGHKRLSNFFNINNTLLISIFSLLDLMLAKTYRTSNIRVVAKKI